jgi:hypothetical protein
MAVLLQPDRTQFALRMAEWLLHLGGRDESRHILELTARFCEEDGRDEAVRLRAQALLDLLPHERAAA